MALDRPNSPWVQGWLVVRFYPPHFGAFFEDRLVAEGKARELGPDFRVKAGRHLPGTDRFAWITEESV